jgi:methionine-R-sulfoxide reductase
LGNAIHRKTVSDPGAISKLEILQNQGILLGMTNFLVLLSGLACLTCIGAETLNTTNAPAAKPTIRVRLLNKEGRPTNPITMEKVIKTDAEWLKQLTLKQYQIARNKGTEPAFCGAFYDHKKPGIYTCICCDLPLFASDAKFDSGTGWPSFFKPIADENVTTKIDLSHGMRRAEILCTRCDAHLGHVFEDGPPPTNLRYCLNSESLKFNETPGAKSETAKKH